MDWKTILSELRDAGFTRERVATECDCSQATVSDLANGVTADPKHTLGERIRALHQEHVTDKKRKPARSKVGV